MSKEEIEQLELIVTAFLDLAESRAKRNIPMTMEDWSSLLDKYLLLDNRDILKNVGRISHEIACDKALTEFEKYRIKQDRLYKSDFDLLFEEANNKESNIDWNTRILIIIKIAHLTSGIFKYIIKLECDYMKEYNIDELIEKLERCRNVNLDDVKSEDVDEISSIKIDRRKPSNEWILDFIMKVKNPYIFKVNGKLVRIGFSNTDKTDEIDTNVLENLYS